MKAYWKDIKGYEGLYEISTKGRVFSVRRNIYLSQCFQGKYLSVLLSVNGVKKGKLVSRLVALGFIPNPENKPEVNHKNGKKWDNRKVNLEWNTHGENISHKYKVLGWENKGGEKRIIIKQFSLKGKLIRKFKSLSEASRITGIDISQICACSLGKKEYKTAGGFIWKR